MEQNLVRDKSKPIKVIWLVFLSIIIWIILIRAGKEKALPNDLALASGVYFLCILPSLIYFKRKEKAVPYIQIFGIMYFMYYAYPVFVNYDLFYISGIAPQQINKSLVLSLLGISSLLLAFYSPLGAIVKVVPHIKIYWDHSKAFNLGIMLSLAGIFMQYIYADQMYNIPARLFAVVGFLASLSLLAIIILYSLQLQNRLSLRWKVFLWVFLIPVRLTLDLTGGLTFFFILDIIIFILIYMQQRQQIPWRGIVIASLITFFIFSVKTDYRSLISYESPEQYSTIPKKVLLYLELLQKRIFGTEKQIAATYERLALRTNNVVLFSRIVYLTPDYIPYWNGYTYNTLLYSIFPRLIVPGKPIKQLGQEFGHRYNLLDYFDRTTSLNLPQLIEMYINFGPLGVIVGMFLMGLLYRSIYVLLNHPDTGQGGFIICLAISGTLLNIESDFSIVFGALIQHIILFYFIVRVMRAPIRRIGDGSTK